MGAIFLKKKAPAATCPEAQGFQKSGGHFSEKKKPLRQRAQKLRASKNMGGHFSEKKKAPAATCPEAQGFQKNLGPFFKHILSRNRLNRLLIYPIMVTKNPFGPKAIPAIVSGYH